MQVIEQLGLLAGDGSRVVITSAPKADSVKMDKQGGVKQRAKWDKAWDVWAHEVCERVFRVPAEGIEPPMIQPEVAACYV